MKRPMSISGIMDEEAARPGESAGARVMAVLSLHRIWPEIVGELAATNCFPGGFRQGCLTVTARTSAWAQEMSLLSPEIQKKLDAALGEGVVTELRFKTGRLPAASRRRPARRKTAPAPEPAPKPEPDPLLKARLEQELARIKDPELREVLLRVRLAAGE